MIFSAALLGLVGALSDGARPEAYRRALSSVQPADPAAAARQLFDAWYRASACSDPGFSRRAAKRAAVISRLRRTGLESREVMPFVRSHLEQRLSDANHHLGPSCLPPLTALQSNEAWISDLRDSLRIAEKLPAQSIVHLAHGLMIVNLLEAEDGTLRPLTAAQREGYLSLLRPEYRRLRPETRVDSPAYGRFSPEFALAWANRLGCPEALESARAYVVANLTDRTLRSDEAASLRREAGLSIVAGFNARGNRAMEAKRKETLLGLACLPETDYDTIAQIQRALKSPVPAHCAEKWRPLVDERLRRLSR